LPQQTMYTIRFPVCQALAWEVTPVAESLGRAMVCHPERSEGRRGNQRLTFSSPHTRPCARTSMGQSRWRTSSALSYWMRYRTSRIRKRSRQRVCASAAAGPGTRTTTASWNTRLAAGKGRTLLWSAPTCDARLDSVEQTKALNEIYEKMWLPKVQLLPAGDAHD
jgi:hypothetical protein